jgi:hypothetical protein
VGVSWNTHFDDVSKMISFSVDDHFTPEVKWSGRKDWLGFAQVLRTHALHVPSPAALRHPSFTSEVRRPDTFFGSHLSLGNVFCAKFLFRLMIISLQR